MDQEEQKHRDVYAQFGRAAYYAQCLEATLTNILVATGSLEGKSKTEEDVSALEAELQKPLGTLIGKVRAKHQLPPQTEEMIRKALQDRNFLIHRFFRERSWGFVTTEGRQKLIAELREIESNLHAADKLAVQLCAALGALLGITPQMLDEEFQSKKRDAEEGR
jgi:hypothetical protein